MLRVVLYLLIAAPLAAQTGQRMLALVNRIPWEQTPPSACLTHTPVQMDVYATVEWTHHCSETRDGVVRESFYFVFGEPARVALLRVDVRPVDESPAVTDAAMSELRRRLTARFGAPTHEPEMMEIGFRHLRYAGPVNGDHWHGGGAHYFLHSNQTNPAPMGMRRGAQLIVLADRLFAERERDALILRAEGFFGEPTNDDPVRLRLQARIGELYTRPVMGMPRNNADRPRFLRQSLDDLAGLLRESDRAGRPRRALYLLAAHQVANKLAQMSDDGAALRRLLSGYGAKVGGPTHQGGLDYGSDLLWRVWREFPETEGGELAFLELQQRSWNTSTDEGCPKDPDLFRLVIERGESFLASHPNTDFRREVTYTMAVANESWWSIAHAKPDDGIVAQIPYPRRAANARQADAARERAITLYKEVVRLAPDSPQAAAALRRIPRLELKLDTGQRRFFCSYC
jgi:hypothetical protein